MFSPNVSAPLTRITRHNAFSTTHKLIIRPWDALIFGFLLVESFLIFSLLTIKPIPVSNNKCSHAFLHPACLFSTQHFNKCNNDNDATGNDQNMWCDKHFMLSFIHIVWTAVLRVTEGAADYAGNERQEFTLHTHRHTWTHTTSYSLQST